MATDIIARGMITEYIAGTNINFTENRDGTVEISASGSISSEDSVARDAIGNHKSDTSNPHNVTPAQIGLGNVDNTSDLDKPISTAVQTALDDKANAKHTHKKSDITDFPDSLPANGGNSDTVNNHTVESDVPIDAVFTDTVYDDTEVRAELNKKINTADIKDYLESTDATSPLSANQGKVLNEKITEHTDNSDIHVTMSDKENWNSHPIDVTASGYHVLLENLQGGVPFSELAVSSANSESSIIGKTFSFKVYGKNILSTKSDYSATRCSSSVPSDNEDAFVLTPTDYTLTSAAYRVKKPLYLKNGESITVKGSYENPNGNTIGVRILANNYIVANTGNITDASGDFELTFTAKRDYYDPINTPNDDIEIVFYVRISGSTAYGAVTYKNVQIEYGDIATDYERAEYTYLSITPDSDPYIIPNEIIQRNGINNISVSESELSVTGVRKNAAIGKLYTDLKSVAFSGSYNDLSDAPTIATTDTDGLMSAEDKTKLDKVSNPNLLINPDFRINQRKFNGVQYPGPNKLYTLDRWFVLPGQGMKVNNDNTVTIYGGCAQFLETDVGNNVTASVGVVSGSAVANYDPETKMFSITTDGKSAVINWAKLEIGSVATPFSPPDPATELLKCQRYYQVIDNGSPIFGVVADSSRIRLTMPIICPMRTNPTLTLLRHTGNFTWSFKITNAAATSFTTTDFSVMSASFIRIDGSVINVYISIPHTLSSNEIVYVSGIGGIYFELDAEIY